MVESYLLEVPLQPRPMMDIGYWSRTVGTRSPLPAPHFHQEEALKMRRIVMLFTVAILMQGCYHATVSTGLRPSTVKIEKKWASGWIFGLVPPSMVETMDSCPAGVAQVDTQHSFPNQLVNFITFGIYTPIEIVVTCAEDRGDLPLATSAEEADELLKSGGSFLIPLD